MYTHLPPRAKDMARPLFPSTYMLDNMYCCLILSLRNLTFLFIFQAVGLLPSPAPVKGNEGEFWLFHFTFFSSHIIFVPLGITLFLLAQRSLVSPPVGEENEQILICLPLCLLIFLLQNSYAARISRA